MTEQTVTDLINDTTRKLAKQYTDSKIYRDYYAGVHASPFTNNEYSPLQRKYYENSCIYNMCQRIVDALVDRLGLTDWSTTDETTAAWGAAAWDLWQDIDGASVLADVLTKASIEGKAFLIVQPAERKTVFFAKHSYEVHVEYDEETQQPLWALHHWRDKDGSEHATYYTPSEIQAYKRDRNSSLWLTDGEPVIPTFPEIPVFEFNNQGSELEHEIPLQNKLNKSSLNSLIAASSWAEPAAMLLGFEGELDANGDWVDPWVSQYGKRHLAMFGAKPGEVELKTIPSNNPEAFFAEQDQIVMQMGRLASIPTYALGMVSGQPPTGEALKTLEIPLVQKGKRKQRVFGSPLTRMASYAVRLQNYLNTGTYVSPDAFKLVPVWQPIETQNPREEYEEAVLLQTLGVPLEWILTDKLGYSSEEAETIAAAAAAKQSPDSLFNAGFDPQG